MSKKNSAGALRRTTRTLIPVVMGACLVGQGAEAQATGADFTQIHGRSIGPAGMSGRVSDVEVVLSDPNTIFVGSATGGVWRSVDGGLTYQPVFDDQRLLGIGALAVFQPNPAIVWAGTGEGNPRNSAGVGNGIYKSVDGGDTWRLMGLEGSERIHRILTHPSDPDVVYVAALGPAWSDGEVRGVFRTTDGGDTWEKVLYVDERTGAADLVMDPSNPNKLIAAMWQFRRWPWYFESGGPGSGIHITYDGGSSWTRQTEEDGLPAGDLGRAGLAFSISNPEIVYALVEAERSEMLRSEDGGRSWRTVTDRSGIAPRPFYYADIRVDPQNENRVYSLHSTIQVSEDQGRTFRVVVPSAIIHGDVHELWIDPEDGRRMIIGNDGGIGFTTDRGVKWRFVENLPLAQFYHIAVDDADPYNVYGGLQDNGSWFGPNTVWEGRGVMNAHWRRVGSGDGFSVYPDRADERILYAASQGGNLTRVDKVTNRRVGIQPVHPDGATLRFNWNAAFNTDPHDPSVIYLGSQFVHRSRDQGRSWEIISPDLTTDDPEKQRFDESGGLTIDASGAETHTTILSISPSPVQQGLIWASTDDGKVHVTVDDGGSWTDLTGRLDDVPEGIWVPHVEPSHHDPQVAYVVMEDHRRGNWTPYAFRTENGGRDWRSLRLNDIDGFIHVLREDPVEPDLLFAGTEFGLFVSLDRGDSWFKHTAGVPPAPIRDMRIHPRDHDLVLGTHGRAIVVVDDIRPFRALAASPTMASAGLSMLPMAPAQKFVVGDGMVGTDKGYRSTGHTMHFGELRPYGAILNYWVGDPSAGEVAEIEIHDASGEVVRRIDGPAERGVNRVVWDLTERTTEDPGDSGGREALGGTYTVRVGFGDLSVEGALEVREDPREPVAVADRIAKREAVEQARSYARMLSEAQHRVDRGLSTLERTSESFDELLDEALSEEAETVRSALTDLMERHFTGPECQGSCGPTEPYAEVVEEPLSTLSGSDERPTPNERRMLRQAEAALQTILDEVNAVFEGPVSSLSASLRAAGYSPFPAWQRLTVGSGGQG